MSYRHIVEKEWPPVDTVQEQCHLMDAICARVVTLRIEKLCKHLKLSEKEGWSLYGLQIIKQVMEQGILWDYLFEILLVMDREYLKNVTDHFRRLNGNHQATLDFLNNLRKTPEFSEYRFVMCYLSYWE
jgi:ribosomal protein S15P/S13E